MGLIVWHISARRATQLLLIPKNFLSASVRLRINLFLILSIFFYRKINLTEDKLIINQYAEFEQMHRLHGPLPTQQH